MTSPADASHTWLEELDVQRCHELLTPKHPGRFAYDDGGPVMLVRHVVHDDTVLCSTSPHRSTGRRVCTGLDAFEVDEIRDETTPDRRALARGLVRGRATNLSGYELPHVDQRPEPWTQGRQSLCVRSAQRFSSGRRLLPGKAEGLDQPSRKPQP